VFFSLTLPAGRDFRGWEIVRNRQFFFQLFDPIFHGFDLKVLLDNNRLPVNCNFHFILHPFLSNFFFAADWFSQRVEIRIALQMMSMMAELHRINTEVPVMAEKAQKKASSSTSTSAKNL